jgi:CheY-like chemotaxis protein
MNSLVLIAEEDPALTDLLRRTLESGDYRATVAADGEEALLCVEEGRPIPRPLAPKKADKRPKSSS